MDMMEEVRDVFRRVFEQDDLHVTRETVAADVPGWDSLMHVTLLLTVERELGVRFTTSEIAGLQNVGEIADLVVAKRRR